ncbi:hypothetical protein B0A52_10321 [Exophiala mesophila]|uniref:Uncharacterized protein n=1 Tax=Exophiala mesophila TaxID=212818 RepID=A0A438MQA9_EXOME|nr:hypothetical protein B0A52_10321 [Exophiala mesophila]
MIVTILAGAACFFLARALFVAFRSGIRDIPGPWIARFTPLYRVSLVWKGDAVREYRRLHEQYGPFVRTGPNAVAVADPKAIPIIYGISSKFRKSDFYKLAIPYLNDEPLDGIFTARDPAQHKKLRAPIAGVYSMTNIRNYEKHIDECTELFTRTMKQFEGQKIDLAEYFHWFAFDAIGNITFQRRFGFIDQTQQGFDAFRPDDFVGQYFSVIGQLPWLDRFLFGNRPLVNAMMRRYPDVPNSLNTVMSVIDREIQRYDEEDKDATRTDFLAQLRKKDNPEAIHFKRDLMNHLSNNMLAGADTISVALGAIFYYIVRHDAVKNKLMKELDGASERGELSDLITYEESLRLPYLQAIIKESLRMHPSLCMPLERVAPPEGATVCGVVLPPGTIVGVMAPIVNRDKGVFGEDADSFRPERWLEADAEHLKVMDRTFFSFGHGTRSCIGKNIAMLEMGKFVPQILRTFDIEWASPTQDWTVKTYWFHRQRNLFFKFTSRK